MSEVNKTNMARWIVALRSGKYAQARAILRQRDTFCCLGVACDISDLGTWDGSVYEAGDERRIITMPRAVSEWLGLGGDENPDLGEVSCVGANDIKQWDFTQIADALESRYLPNTTAAKVLEGE